MGGRTTRVAPPPGCTSCDATANEGGKATTGKHYAKIHVGRKSGGRAKPQSCGEQADAATIGGASGARGSCSQESMHGNLHSMPIGRKPGARARAGDEHQILMQSGERELVVTINAPKTAKDVAVMA